jgi:hypothetical protein
MPSEAPSAPDAANVEEGVGPVDAFKAVIADKTDTLAGVGDAIVALEAVSSLFPRGRYALSLFPAFMDMDGQTHQFKIRCAAICIVAVQGHGRWHVQYSSFAGHDFQMWRPTNKKHLCTSHYCSSHLQLVLVLEVAFTPSCAASNGLNAARTLAIRWLPWMLFRNKTFQEQPLNSGAQRNIAIAPVEHTIHRCQSFAAAKMHLCMQPATAFVNSLENTALPQALCGNVFVFRYTNIERIYTLPRPGPQGNLVIVHLENAIRRGQTYYEWICFFFDHKAHEELTLNTDQDARSLLLSAFGGTFVVKKC